MSVFGLLRPKWQHPDAAIRLAAIERLADQAVLARVVEEDPDERVRAAALNRVTDQELLAGIAKSRSPFSTRAVESLTDSRLVAKVAREAETPGARALAVRRVDDKVVLQQVASQDPDPEVRMQARIRQAGRDGMQEVLKSALSKLQIAEASAASVAEFCGDLDQVCGALLRDTRFRIDGVIATAGEEPARADGAVPSTPRIVELVARPADGAAARYYHIKMWRPAEHAFHGSLEERKPEAQRDFATWSRSTSGT